MNNKIVKEKKLRKQQNDQKHVINEVKSLPDQRSIYVKKSNSSNVFFLEKDRKKVLHIANETIKKLEIQIAATENKNIK